MTAKRANLSQSMYTATILAAFAADVPTIDNLLATNPEYQQHADIIAGWKEQVKTKTVAEIEQAMDSQANGIVALFVPISIRRAKVAVAVEELVTRYQDGLLTPATEQNFEDPFAELQKEAAAG